MSEYKLYKEDLPKWHLVFLLLSMEITVDFFEEMKLDIHDPIILAEISKSFVRKYRVIENQAVKNEKVHFSKYEEIFLKTYQRIEEELGENEGDTIYSWGTNIFQYGSENSGIIFIWMRLIRQMVGELNQQFPVLHLPFDGEINKLIKQSAKSFLQKTGMTERKITTVEQRKKRSDWENQIFATYTTNASPLDWVNETIVYVNFLDFWKTIKAILSAEEQNDLIEWGRLQAKSMDMPIELVRKPPF